MRLNSALDILEHDDNPHEGDDEIYLGIEYILLNIIEIVGSILSEVDIEGEFREEGVLEDLHSELNELFEE